MKLKESMVVMVATIMNQLSLIPKKQQRYHWNHPPNQMKITNRRLRQKNRKVSFLMTEPRELIRKVIEKP